MTSAQIVRTQPSRERERSRRSLFNGWRLVWQGGSLWIGEGQGRTQWHEHHAHQLALALEGSFRFRTDAEGAWTAFDGAIVPSHCPHQFEVNGSATMVHALFEPESRAGRALMGAIWPERRFGSSSR